MIDTNLISELTQKLSSALPESAQSLKSDLESNFKAILEASLQQMNLVSREEFDTQSALLERTLEKLDQLEKQLKELEEDI